MSEKNVSWNVDNMVQITLNNPDDFLKIKETLTRIGIVSRKDNSLYQSCHILHKKGNYFIVSFKEMFCIDGKKNNLTKSDLLRRNSIIQLLCDWKMCNIVDSKQISEKEDIKNIRIIKYSDKNNWNLKSKYTVGGKL